MPKICYSTAIAFSVAALAMPSEGRAQAIPGIASLDAFQDLPNVSFQYYDVYGSDEESISASLNKNAPARPDGSKAMAATGYKVSFSPFRVGSGSGCKVTKLKIQTSAFVILPKLHDESAVPERILVRWRSFIAGLREHEAGHVRIEYRHMRKIESELAGNTCASIQAKFEAARNGVVDIQRAYDRETDNGLTQGAILR